MKAHNPRVFCYNAMFLEDETNLHSCAGVRLGNLGFPHEACVWKHMSCKLLQTLCNMTTPHKFQMKRLTPASVQLQAVGGHLVLQLGGPVLGHRGQLVPALARLQHRARPQQPDCWSPRGAPCTGRWKLSPRRCWSSPRQACAGTKTITTQAQIDMNILIFFNVILKTYPKRLNTTPAQFEGPPLFDQMLSSASPEYRANILNLKEQIQISYPVPCGLENSFTGGDRVDSNH